MSTEPHRVGDPSPEYTEDSPLWTMLLRLAAWHGDAPAYSALHCVRAGGAQLSVKNGLIRIEPRYSQGVTLPDTEQERDSQSGMLVYVLHGETQWENELQWARDRKAMLVPNTATIKTLFAMLQERLQDQSPQKT